MPSTSLEFQKLATPDTVYNLDEFKSEDAVIILLNHGGHQIPPTTENILVNGDALPWTSLIAYSNADTASAKLAAEIKQELSSVEALVKGIVLSTSNDSFLKTGLLFVTGDDNDSTKHILSRTEGKTPNTAPDNTKKNYSVAVITTPIFELRGTEIRNRTIHICSVMISGSTKRFTKHIEMSYTYGDSGSTWSEMPTRGIRCQLNFVLLDQNFERSAEDTQRIFGIHGGVEFLVDSCLAYTTFNFGVSVLEQTVKDLLIASKSDAVKLVRPLSQQGHGSFQIMKQSGHIYLGKTEYHGPWLSLRIGKVFPEFTPHSVSFAELLPLTSMVIGGPTKPAVPPKLQRTLLYKTAQGYPGKGLISQRLVLAIQASQMVDRYRRRIANTYRTQMPKASIFTHVQEVMEILKPTMDSGHAMNVHVFVHQTEETAVPSDVYINKWLVNIDHASVLRAEGAQELAMQVKEIQIVCSAKISERYGLHLHMPLIQGAHVVVWAVSPVDYLKFGAKPVTTSHMTSLQGCKRVFEYTCTSSDTLHVFFYSKSGATPLLGTSIIKVSQIHDASHKSLIATHQNEMIEVSKTEHCSSAYGDEPLFFGATCDPNHEMVTAQLLF